MAMARSVWLLNCSTWTGTSVAWSKERLTTSLRFRGPLACGTKAAPMRLKKTKVRMVATTVKKRMKTPTKAAMMTMPMQEGRRPKRSESSEKKSGKNAG